MTAENDNPDWSALVESGETLRDEGRLEEAIAVLFQSVELAKQAEDSDAKCAQSYGLLGGVYAKLNDLNEAERYLKKALDLNEKIYGANSLQLAESLRQLGWLFVLQMKFERAESLLRHALRIAESLGPTQLPQVFATLDGLAEVLSAKGLTDDANELFESRLATLQGPEEAEQEAKANLLMSWANFLFRQDRFEKAAECMQQVYETGMKLQWPALPKLAVELADLRRKNGQYQEAETLIVDAIEQLEESEAWAEKPELREFELASAKHSLALLYMDDEERITPEKILQARIYLQEAEQVYIKTLGPNHSTVALLLARLADVYNITGEVEQSRTACQRVIEICQKSDLSDNVILPFYEQLGLLEEKLGNPEAAEPLFKKVIQICRDCEPPNYDSLTRSLVELASISIKSMRFKEAENFLKEIVMIRDELNKPEYPDLVRVLTELAKTICWQRKPPGSENHISRARQIVERNIESAGPELPRLLTSLADVYLMQGDFNEGLKLTNRAVQEAETRKGNGLSSQDLAHILLDLSDVHWNMNDKSQAKVAIERAFKAIDSRDDDESKGETGTVYLRAATIYDVMDEHDKADAALDFVENLCESSSRLTPLFIEQLQYHLQLMKQLNKNARVEAITQRINRWSCV